MDDLEILLLKKHDELHDELLQLLSPRPLQLTLEDYQRLTIIINQFEPNPVLLDRHLSFYIDTLSNYYIDLESSLKRNLSQLIYNVSKIRGFKQISNHLSNDIYLVEKIIRLLNDENVDTNSFDSFVLLLWLSNLVLIPFPLISIDEKLPQQIYDVVLRYLTKNNGKEQLISTIVLYRFLTRVDVIALGFLETYFARCVDEWDTINNVHKMGHLLTIKNILKKCPFDVLSTYLDVIYESIVLKELEQSTSELATNKLLLVKILSKLGMNYIHLDNRAKVEFIFNDLMEYLNDNDTSVRECFSKNLAKLCGLLPAEYRLEVIDFLLGELEISNLKLSNFIQNLDVDYDNLSIPKYHSILLIMGELCRNHLIPLDYLPILASIVSRTLFFSQNRVTFSVGSQIRDSSCFICWSIFKKYSAKELSMEVLDTFLINLILVACFDRDLVVRRASSATLQELIGRFGSKIFEGRVAVVGELLVTFIENFDFIKLGQLKESFQICLQLVHLGFDKNMFLGFLLKNGLRNSEYESRKLSAILIGQLTNMNNIESLVLFNHEGANINCDSIIDTLLDTIETAPSYDPIEGYFYVIAQLLPSSTTSYTARLIKVVDNMKYDYHRDASYKGEELLHLLSSIVLLDNNVILTQNIWDLVMGIIRQTDDMIIEKFSRLLEALSENQLSSQTFDKLLYYIRNNNLTSSKSIGHHKHLSLQQLEQLVDLAGDKKVDAFCRSNLIQSMDYHIQLESTDAATHRNIIEKLVNQLDDYTLTNQGDVGNKIRISTIQLIKHNYHRFSDSDLLFQIELKLTRIMGEVMDRLRIESLYVLFEMKGYSFSEFVDSADNSDEYFKFYFNDLESYYSFILNYYYTQILSNLVEDPENERLKQLSKEFWKGYVFSGGAIAATNSTISASLRKFLELFEKKLTSQEKTIVLNDLLSLLKIDPRQNQKNASKDHGTERIMKAQICCLNLLARIFESGIDLPSDFNYKGVYVRCYNLHLNTSNVTRISLVLKNFTYLSMYSGLSEPKKRLAWLCCNHPLARIRDLASESLFEVYNELMNEGVGTPEIQRAIQLLETVNWNEDAKGLTGYLKELDVL